jgi:hypothetical protein
VSVVMSYVRLAVLFVVFAAPAGPTLVGCGGSGCLGNAVSGLSVTVLDGPGGAAVCGATVVATDGTYSETLAASPSGGPCFYSGATERTGTYALEATFEGRTATTPNVSVGKDECHVITQEVQLVLPAS